MKIRLEEFGGSLLKGKRKSKRPIPTKIPTHLVFKATTSECLLRHKATVEKVIRQMSDRFAIQIFEIGTHADHIHLSAKFSSESNYRKWVRATTGQLAKKIPHLKWKLRPFTKPVWSIAQKDRLNRYIQKNEREGEFILKAHEKVNAFRDWALTQLAKM